MLSEKDQPRRAFLFHRAYPALGKRVQVRTACRQLQGFGAGFDHLAKHRTELAVAIMQQVAMCARKPQSFIVTFRACCSIHCWSGYGVIPARHTRRVSSWRKNSTSYVTKPLRVR